MYIIRSVAFVATKFDKIFSGNQPPTCMYLFENGYPPGFCCGVLNFIKLWQYWLCYVAQNADFYKKPKSRIEAAETCFVMYIYTYFFTYVWLIQCQCTQTYLPVRLGACILYLHLRMSPFPWWSWHCLLQSNKNQTKTLLDQPPAKVRI
jgi:hypothetical protein